MSNFQLLVQRSASKAVRSGEVEPRRRRGVRCVGGSRHSARSALHELLALPFDLVRHAHACAVRAGALPLSMRESQRFEQQLGSLERLLLGPLARRV